MTLDHAERPEGAGDFAEYVSVSSTSFPALAITVNEAQDDDLRVCAELSCSYSGGDVSEREVALAKYLADSSRCLFVARYEDAVIAYGKVDYFKPPPDSPSTVAPEGYYLGGLVVTAAARRSGVGAALTRARMAWAAERASEIWYFSNARNRVSLDLHAKLGFSEVTRDFEYPGASFIGGVGVLCRAHLDPSKDSA